MRRWRFRKVTPEILKQMRDLRAEGWTYYKIAKKFKLNWRTVKYWLDPKTKEKTKEKAQRKKKKKITEEERIRRREYIRNYIRERYRSDPEFRERMLSHMKRWNERKKIGRAMGS